MASAPATYVGLYPGAEDRATQAAVIAGNLALKAMTGPSFGIDNYTYGAMMANEYLGFMLIFVGLDGRVRRGAPHPRRGGDRPGRADPGHGGPTRSPSIRSHANPSAFSTPSGLNTVRSALGRWDLVKILARAQRRGIVQA